MIHRASSRRHFLRSLALVSLGAVGFLTDAAPAHAAGRPKVELDELTFPDIPQAAIYKKHLERTLKKEVRRAEWGAGRGSVIEYRFTVEELQETITDGVLTVRCKAVGRLPKGKTARSQLSFGGTPKDRSALIRRVLDIVARGVITRLAEMERIRRGQLNNRGVPRL
jgi:hypothetical protein